MRLLRAAAEVTARQLYWRFPSLAARFQRGGAKRHGAPEDAIPQIEAQTLVERIQEVTATAGGLLMVHSSLDTFRILDESGTPLPPPKAAIWLIEQLRAALGPDGTLCMPTHPLYLENPGFMFDKSELILKYQPKRTPSSTGLLTEFFRRTKDVQRSQHPLSSLAVQGPLAAELLANNLNENKPLPHGRDSGYYRFCQRGGAVLGLGVDLLKVLTVLHVPEEVRDESWPVRGFFYDRQFILDDGAAGSRNITVRERRPEFVRSLTLSLVRRDFKQHGILVETKTQGVLCDTVDPAKMLSFMEDRQRRSTYPYLLPKLAGMGRPPKVPRG